MPFKIKYIVLLLSGLFFTIIASGQTSISNFGVKKYGMKVDEPFHSAMQLNQDSTGRLIFDRFAYDGNEFTKHNEAEEWKIIHVEENGNTWSEKDHYNIRYQTERSTYYIDIKEHLNLPISSVEHFGNRKLIISKDGIIEFYHGDSLTHTKTISIPGDEIINSFVIGDTVFLKKFKSSSYHLINELGKEYLVEKNDNSNFINNIIYLTKDRVCLKSLRSNTILENDHPYTKLIRNIGDNQILKYLLDSKNRLWLSIRLKSIPEIIVADNSEKYESIPLNLVERPFILSLLEDNNGNIWAGTQGEGLIQIFEESIKVIDKKAGTSVDNIWSIEENDAGDLYLITACTGIDIFRSDGTKDHLNEKNCNFTSLMDSKGRYWVAYNGVILFENGKKPKFYSKESGLTSRTVHTIFEDSNQDIWVGTRKALHKYSADGFEKFNAPKVEEFDRVLAMREYAKGKFIIGFDSGIIFTFDGGTYQPVSYEGVGLNSIFKDQEGNVIICSDSTGLYTFQDEKIIPIANEGMPLTVKLLQDDNMGYLWGICEGNRIFRVKKRDLYDTKITATVNYFGIDEGIPLIATNNHVQPNSALLQSGAIIFPNIYGAIHIDPKKINSAEFNYTSEVYHNDTLLNTSIQLDYGQNDIAIDIKTINLTPHQQIEYRYALNEEWAYVNNKNIIINNIPNGKNKLKIQSKSINGEWRTDTVVDIAVPLLIYQYPLFWLAVLAIVALIVYIMVRWKTKIEVERNKILEKQVSIQTKAIINEKQQLAESLKQQRILTKELNYAQAAKNRMYAQISHEFKSPLQAIKSHLERGDRFLQKEDSLRIKGNINNLLEISNEIMELSKAESGKLKANPNWYNINGVLLEQLELKYPLIEIKNIKVETTGLTKKQYLYFDLSMIQKVIANLLSNAIKFSQPQSTLKINSRIDGTYQLIEVIDQGPGIPSDEIDNLTMAYYQASNNMEDGTGIGLSLAQEMLKLHDSKLEIKSQLGKGSNFSFRLTQPAKTQREIVQDNINALSIEEQLHSIIDPKKPVLLAVDDSQDVLFFINNALSENYYIISVSNGAEALKLLEKIKPTAVISDYNMPLMNGMQLLKEVRKKPNLQTLPFLVLTGSSSEETELQSIKAGADIILRKPIREELLKTTLRQLLNRQKTISNSIKSSFAHDLLPKNIQNDDLELMQALENIFLEHIGNSKLKSTDIAIMVGIGEKTLRNRVKTITGKTLKEYYRNFRLEKAKLLLDEGYGTMGEVASATGFSSLSYFSKSYKKYFGKNSTEA